MRVDWATQDFPLPLPRRAIDRAVADRQGGPILRARRTRIDRSAQPADFAILLTGAAFTSPGCKAISFWWISNATRAGGALWCVPVNLPVRPARLVECDCTTRGGSADPWGTWFLGVNAAGFAAVAGKSALISLACLR